MKEVYALVLNAEWCYGITEKLSSGCVPHLCFDRLASNSRYFYFEMLLEYITIYFANLIFYQSLFDCQF